MWHQQIADSANFTLVVGLVWVGPKGDFVRKQAKKNKRRRKEARGIWNWSDLATTSLFTICIITHELMKLGSLDYMVTNNGRIHLNLLSSLKIIDSVDTVPLGIKPTQKYEISVDEYTHIVKKFLKWKSPKISWINLP